MKKNSTKLTDRKIRNIQKAHAKGESMRVISKKYKISITTAMKYVHMGNEDKEQEWFGKEQEKLVSEQKKAEEVEDEGKTASVGEGMSFGNKLEQAKQAEKKSKEKKQEKSIRDIAKKIDSQYEMDKALGKIRPAKYDAGTYSDKFMAMRNLSDITSFSDIKDPFLEYLLEESQKIDNVAGLSQEMKEQWQNKVLEDFNKPFINNSRAVRRSYEKLADEQGYEMKPGENYYAIPYERFVNIFNTLWINFQFQL